MALAAAGAIGVAKSVIGDSLSPVRRGQLLNLQMAREDHGVVCTTLLKRCPQTQDLLLQAEQQARQQRLNVWNQDNPVLPWDYRRSNR